MMLRILGTVALALALAACGGGPTPYVPAGSDGGGYGYAAQQIEGNRFRVSFSGNSLTDRGTVENYLLYRAAELTLAQGAEHFVVVDRKIDADTTYHTSYDRPPYYWPHHYRDPFWHPGFGPSSWREGTTRAVTRYDAHAEIVLHPGPKPAGDPRAFDARQVIEHLGPAVVRLKPRAG